MTFAEARKSEVLDPDVALNGQRLDPIEKARRNPKSRKLAIAAKCWDCQGGGIDPGGVQRIRECLSPTCPLYPVRPYKDSPEDEATRLAAMEARAADLRARGLR